MNARYIDLSILHSSSFFRLPFDILNSPKNSDAHRHAMMHTQPYYNYPEVWQNGDFGNGDGSINGVAKPAPLFVTVPNDVQGSVGSVAAVGSGSASMLDEGNDGMDRSREGRKEGRDGREGGPPSNGYSFAVGNNMPAGVSWRYVDVLSNIHQDDGWDGR